MLDIKFIRENADLVQAGAKKKHIDFDVKKLLEVDDQRKSVSRELESKKARQNEFNKKIAGAPDDLRRDLIIEMRSLKEEIQKLEENLKEIMIEWHKLMVGVPNIPDVSVPDGSDEVANKEIKKWGDKPQFNFTPQNHIDLMQKLEMIDLERGTKVSGFRGYFLKNDGALLSFAIWQFALDHFLAKGFAPMIVPSLVKKENLIGSGYLPQGEDDLYKTQDNNFLSGTAEVATMGFHMDEVLESKNLPIKYLSFSSCFRREAGSHGKDVKGLIRVHEFYKMEQVIICEGSHDISVRHHEELNRNTEEFIEKLSLPYRTVINCGGDLGLGQVKKYDIELWVSGEKKYREIGSTSYFHDFQTRRFNIRYRDPDGKLKYAHSLNSTAIPTPRILVSLVENYQQEDGSIIIPEVLQPYLGGKAKIQAK